MLLQITNPASDFSLYKVYQNGEKRELAENDSPLMQRLWMGPFNEDRLFIMERGRALNMSQELINLIGLSDTLLRGLLDNMKQEEDREATAIRSKYASYAFALSARKKHIDDAMNALK